MDKWVAELIIHKCLPNLDNIVNMRRKAGADESITFINPSSLFFPDLSALISFFLAQYAYTQYTADNMLILAKTANHFTFLKRLFMEILICFSSLKIFKAQIHAEKFYFLCVLPKKGYPPKRTLVSKTFFDCE